MGRLSETTGIQAQTLHRRLANPDDFRLPELAAVAIALDVNPGTLFELWASRNGAGQ